MMSSRQPQGSQFELICPDDIPWEKFPDPHNRPTTPVRILKSTNPYILQADFPPHFHAGLHWHPYDTVYLITKGRLRFGEEGWFEAGDIRWVKAGHSYGPEEAGPEGVQFFLVSLGGAIGLNWSDLYETPAELTERLKTFACPVGRAQPTNNGQRVHLTSFSLEPICAEDPFLSRLEMRPNTRASLECLDFDTVFLLRSGTISYDGQTIVKDQILSIQAGSRPSILSTNSLSADVIVLTIGGPFHLPETS